MPEFNIGEILEMIPHRYPMIMVDRILECDDKTRIVGIKNVSVNEPCFQGHFPGRPVMPGVLQLEAMAQTGGILLIRISQLVDKMPYFMSIDKVKFRKVVVPGDQLRIEAEITKVRTRIGRFSARILVDGEVVSEAEMTCMLAEVEPDA